MQRDDFVSQMQKKVAVPTVGTSAVRLPPGSYTLFDVVESWICGLVGLGTLLVLIAAAGSLSISAVVSGPIWLLLCVPLLLLEVAEVWVWARLWWAIWSRHHPVGLWLASKHPRLRWPLGEMAGVFWLLHALLLYWLAVVVSATSYTHGAKDGPLPMLAIMGLGFTFLGNVYAALFLANVSSRRATLEGFWKWRLVVDVTVLAAGLLLSAFGM